VEDDADACPLSSSITLRAEGAQFAKSVNRVLPPTITLRAERETVEISIGGSVLARLQFSFIKGRPDSEVANWIGQFLEQVQDIVIEGAACRIERGGVA